MAVISPMGMKRKVQRSVTKWLELKRHLSNGQSLSLLQGPNKKIVKKRIFRAAFLAASPSSQSRPTCPQHCREHGVEKDILSKECL